MSNKQNGFVFDENEQLEYEWPVTIYKPGSDVPHLVSITFYSKSMEQLSELEERAEEEDEIHNLAREVVAGWPQDGDKTFRNPDGRIMEVTNENKQKLFNHIYIASAVTKAFFASQGGKKRKTRS